MSWKTSLCLSISLFLSSSLGDQGKSLIAFTMLPLSGHGDNALYE